MEPLTLPNFTPTQHHRKDAHLRYTARGLSQVELPGKGGGLGLYFGLFANLGVICPTKPRPPRPSTRLLHLKATSPLKETPPLKGTPPPSQQPQPR